MKLLVEQDIAEGRLQVLDVDELPRAGTEIAISACHQASNPAGPAGRWLIDHLKTLANTAANTLADTSTSASLPV